MFIRKLLDRIRPFDPVLDRNRLVSELSGFLTHGGDGSGSLLPWLTNVGAPEVFHLDLDALRAFVDRLGQGRGVALKSTDR